MRLIVTPPGPQPQVTEPVTAIGMTSLGSGKFKVSAMNCLMLAPTLRALPSPDKVHQAIDAYVRALVADAAND